MAANSALLALPCGTGVPVPRSHLRRILASKAHKTAIMAVKPAMQYEGSVLASIPRQLHRSSVLPKRNKTVVAAYQDIKIEVIPGVPEYTKGELHNFCGEALKLDDKYFLEGYPFIPFPKTIANWETGEFEQKAGSNGSIGGLEYVFLEDKYKWIIAWSNAKDDLNKVYTEILQDAADWDQIKENLGKSGDTCTFNGLNHGIPYSSSVQIDKTSPKPTMRAILKKARPFLPPFPHILALQDQISKGSAEDEAQAATLQGKSQQADENAKPE